MIGTTLNGRFALVKELGRGGMGAVYRATDSLLHRSVAIKVLKDLRGDEVGHRIRLEAQILARLVHHNIVRLYDFNVDGGTYYFIMEEVDGSNFGRRRMKLPLADRLRVVAETAEALDYAHRQGVIHRDVKPANILLTAADQAKLSDFGLSLLADATQDSGVIRGTPHYMSPEQARGRKIDHRTDLYALGVILYECTTGAPPFTGPAMTIMAQHVNAEPEPPRSRNPEVSEELEAMVLWLMAKDPADRPSSGAEVAARLRGLVSSGRAGGGSSAGIPPLPLSTNAGESAASGPSPSMDASGSSAVGTLVRSSAAPPSRPAAKAPGRDLAQSLVDAITAEPIALSPDERYLHGHYLAYLLGGSRRRGFLLRRPLDPLNADRARLLLAMTALTLPDAEGLTPALVAPLLDLKPEVRPLLSPVVAARYLAQRDTPAKRRRFRRVRQQLQQASEHAARHLTDDSGVLNPGLMPQALDDMRRLAPARTEVDDFLVERWNRVAEVWRGNPEFRDSVLRYATKGAWRDPASRDLWPEVVYPLIERARRQRQLRSGTEAFRDAVFGSLLHLGDAGVKLDRAIRRSVPVEVVRDLDVALVNVVDEAVAELVVAPPPPPPQARPAIDPDSAAIPDGIAAASFHDLEVEDPTRHFVRLINADPLRMTAGELRALSQEAIAAMRAPGSATAAHRHVPLGLYRLVVIPSIRSRSAGQLAIQGMPNKQIELLVPPFHAGGPASKVALAIWLWTNNSVAVTYFDNLNNRKFILWDAEGGRQTNSDHADDFHHNLYLLGLEVPDQVDRALTGALRPQNPG